MPWDRGAWEKQTSGVGNTNQEYNRPTHITVKPKKVSNKKKDYLKKNLGQFVSQGWKISKKKVNLYLDNNYYNAPYRLLDNFSIAEKISKLISSKSNENKILVVSNSNLILNEVQLEFIIKNNYRIFKSSKSTNKLENLVNNVEEFEKINKILFNKYAIKIFSDIESINNIQDLKILSQNLYYIDNKASKLLNDFLKSYWKYYELSNFSNIDLNLAEKDVISEVNALSNKLISIKSYVNRLNKILELLDFKIDNLNEFDYKILNNDPTLINKIDKENFLNVLEKYHKLNSSEYPVSTYIEQFPSNNFILGVITNYKRFIGGQQDYKNINQEMIDLKNQFEVQGMHINNLNEYYEIKDKLPHYENVYLIDNDDYVILNEKLKEFLKINLSFNDYFESCRKNVIYNLNSNFIHDNVNDALNRILNICEDLGVKINSLKDFENHENDFKVIVDYINFNKMNTVANETTIKEYAKNLFDDLKDICHNLIENTVEVDESELDYIIYNISILKRQVNKIGLNISSLNEINDSFPIISNLENDISDSIFTNQTNSYLQNEKSQIHSDLDTLKNSLNYLLEQLNNQPDLKDYSLEKLSHSFNNQFKLGFLISNIESYIISSNSFEDILENYDAIIQNANNLADLNGSNELKTKLDKLLREFNSISQMHSTKNYSSNQLMIDSISLHKSSINKEFNKLISNGMLSKENIDGCDAEEKIAELNSNMDIVREFIKSNGLYDLSFEEIIKKNNDTVLKNQEIKKSLDESTIYNFSDLCNQLENQDNNYELVQEILDLSSKLDLKEYNEYKDFTLDDIIDFSKNLDYSVEFSEYVKKGVLDENFKFSINQIEELNSKIDYIKNKLIDLNLNCSLLDDFSQIDVSEVKEIQEKLNQIEKNLKSDESNVDVLIQNYKLSLDMLLNLCKDYFIEFEMNNNKFNSSDFLFNLEAIKEDFEYHIRLYEIENEILSYRDIIENNLIDIWENPLTDMDAIKNKLSIDEEFTEKYDQGIYTKTLLENISDVSQNDLLFLEDLKNMDDNDLKSLYISSYENREIIIREINKLTSLHNDDLDLILQIFININRIYKSRDISDCINLLEYNIKHNDSIKLLNEYENNLKTHSIVYYRYFNSRKFDMPIEDVLTILENHFKYTKLIDDEVINERYLDSIKSNFDDFLKNVEVLDDLKTEILSECDQYYGVDNVSFEEIKESWNDIEDANLVLMNLNTLRSSFNNTYVDYFDYVYLVDDADLNDEDKLHLFLISKNKLSYLKLREE
jgi:hypothetical protein